MTSSQQNRLNSVLNRGTPFVFVSKSGKDTAARFYANQESRGYSTGYCQKTFFYLIRFKNEVPIDICGVGNLTERRTMRKYWDENGFDYNITDSTLWEQLVN